MGKIFFFIGLILSFFIILLFNNECVKYDVEYRYKFTFKEKQIPQNIIPLFIQPTDSDKINFIKYRNEKYFIDLMVRYLYVPVEEEGFIYALLASNQFRISKAEFFIYRYLSKYPFSKFTYDFGMEHLKKGIKCGEGECISEYERIKGYE